MQRSPWCRKDKHMAKRKALSKGVRFETFKRDGFCCYYCGANPTTTTLEVDHVKPIKEGGTNDPSNLVTACVDCNRGKSATPLSKKKLKPRAATEAIEAQRQQLESYSNHIAQLEAAKDEVLQAFTNQWFAIVCPERDRFGGGLKNILRSFSKKHRPQTLIEAMYVVSRKADYFQSDNHCVRYFCGVVKRISSEEASHAH